ncbi:hypothetical protein BDA96_01G576100 [Sorghum bicolor]|uniref:Cation-transporting P-type ATPase N-terminal domain-containing protein n=2 Tax=Sorghum bicolor TaxID=4558 RepID=A0A921S6X5_SORBI|nr:hypothetical protein BDA96_01G576100 [Sorghum bicolor]
MDMASSDDMAMADLETGEEEEVLRRLGTAEEAGLTDNEAARRLRLHGPNVVVLSHHHEGSMLQRFLMALFSLWGWDHVFPKYNNMVRIILNSMSWVTVLTTIAITSAGQRPCELAIVVFIVATSLIACFIAKLVLEYAKAPLEAKAHSPRAKVLRDGRWRDVHAANLVPGDIIFLKVGDIVPANARVLRFQKIDTMTCWAKRSVDCAHDFLIYYAWTVSCGQGTAVVIATGRGIPRSTLRLYPQRYARPGQLKEGVMLAACFCASLVLVGTIAEIVLSFLLQKQNCTGMPLNAHFMPLIGGIPMAMPVFLYLALAWGSVRLCFLGIASRGTVALEDLASVDVILFNMTGTLTCNQPCFVRDKIEMFADGVSKDHAIILAARASRSQHELYIEPIDAAILRLLDDPEQARFGVQVLEHHACFFVALKLMFQTTYIDEGNGSKCCVFKGDPTKVAHQCGCSKEVKEKISTLMDELTLDGYQAIAVGHQVDSCWEFIALMPYTDDLRSDSADVVDSLIDLGLDIRVLTESPLSTTKQVCGKLGKLGTNVVPAHSVFELARNNIEVHSNINGISDLFPGTSFAMLFERVELNKSPDRWRVQKIITSGAAFGSYIVLTTAIFYWVASTANPFACKFKPISLMGSDEEIRAALFLQMSTINQAIALFVHSDGCCIIRFPGPVVTFSFVVSQMVATQKVVHGDLNYALTKGIGCVRAGLIWLYNLVLLLTLVLVCRKWGHTKMTSEKLLTICMRSAILHIVLIWFLYVVLDVRVHQPVSS